MRSLKLGRGPLRDHTWKTIPVSDFWSPEVREISSDAYKISNLWYFVIAVQTDKRRSMLYLKHNKGKHRLV